MNNKTDDHLTDHAHAPSLNDVRRCLKVLEEKPGAWVDRTSLRQYSHLKGEKFDIVLDHLIGKGQVEEQTVGDGVRQRREYRLAAIDELAVNKPSGIEYEGVKRWRHRKKAYSPDEATEGYRYAMKKAMRRLADTELSDTKALEYIDRLLDANDRYLDHLMKLAEVPSLERMQIASKAASVKLTETKTLEASGSVSDPDMTAMLLATVKKNTNDEDDVIEVGE